MSAAARSPHAVAASSAPSCGAGPEPREEAGSDGWKAAGALLATSFDYLEPDSTGAWRPVLLQRAEDRSFYFCSG